MSWILPGKLKPRPGALTPWVAPAPGVAPTPEGKVPVKLTLPGTSPSGFSGPHCGRCPLEVDTYCDIGFFCCRWCWYRDTYSGGLAP